MFGFLSRVIAGLWTYSRFSHRSEPQGTSQSISRKVSIRLSCVVRIVSLSVFLLPAAGGCSSLLEAGTTSYLTVTKQPGEDGEWSAGWTVSCCAQRPGMSGR